MSSLGLAVLAVLLLACSATSASSPKAPPLSFTVARNGDVELALRGFSKAGKHPLQAFISTLPPAGNLFMLSQPYRDSGTGPKYEQSTLITSANLPVRVVDKPGQNRIVYVPPKGMAAPNGKWGSFDYHIIDSTGARSNLGKVDLLPPSNVIVGSDFSLNTDGWVCKGNGLTADPIQHEPSRQGKLNSFVHCTDDLIDISQSTSENARWSFCAPVKFKQNYELAYGGSLEFTLGSFSGDFSQLNDRMESVVLECQTCNLGRGMRFVQRDLSFSGTVKSFTLELSESASAGWLKDPKNENTKGWNSPSPCEMVEMLSSISEICILGDHTKWYETVGLDSVAIKAGKNHAIPKDCLCSNPGTQCTAAALS